MKDKVIAQNNPMITRSISGFFKLIIGPSSSHTFGPYRMAVLIRKKIKAVERPVVGIRVHLYGSIAKTGPGHKSPQAILAGLQGVPMGNFTDAFKILNANQKNILIDGLKIPFDFNRDFIFETNSPNPHQHPNTIQFEILTDTETLSFEFASVGGGRIVPDTAQALEPALNLPDYFQFSGLKNLTMKAVSHRDGLIGYLLERESILTGLSQNEIKRHQANIFRTMMQGIALGRKHQGFLPSQLAHYRSHQILTRAETKMDHLSLAYGAGVALAEHNASGGILISAPTAGGGGVLPGVLYANWKNEVPFKTLAESLLVAGALGLIIEKNATLSGAVGGCTFEIGAATIMSTAAQIYIDIGKLLSPSELLAKIDQGTEMVLEHTRYLPCDPVRGLVEIPCIERNGIYAMSALSFARAVELEPNAHQRIGFDEMLQVAYSEATAQPSELKETACGGAACIRELRPH